MNAIVIPFIDLYESRAAAFKLGHKLNVNVLDKEECSNEDIVALIKQDMAEGINVNSDDYLQEISLLYKRNPTSIGRLRAAARRDNNPIFRTFSKEELEEETISIVQKFPGYAVYKSDMRVAHEQGLGGLLTKMASTKKKKGVLIMYPAKVDAPRMYAERRNQILSTAETFDLDIEVIQLELPRK